MNQPHDQSGLPPAVLAKLKEIQNEDRRVRCRAGLLRALAIFLSAMLLAMVIDWLSVLHDSRARWALTLLALACGLAAFIRGFVQPMLQRRSLASVARQVDQSHPGLEERFQTLAGFAQSKTTPELRGSNAMLDKVAEEAAAMSATVRAAAIISRDSIARAAKFLGSVAAAFVLLLVVNFQQTRILLERFWAPAADITMTRIETKPGDAVIGKGDNLSVSIITSGKIAEQAQLFLGDAGREEIIPLQSKAASAGRFTYAINAAADSFEYRVRAGDAQTVWHKVTVMDRPKITQVKLRIEPPAYSHLPLIEQSALPRQVRALEGSEMDVSFQSDQPLASMELKFDDGKKLPITESSDHSYHFKTTLSNTVAFSPVFTNQHHLENIARPTCQVVVYPDQPPTVTVITPQTEITARHEDKVKINFEARDDFGVTKAEMEVTIKGETNSIILPIPLTKEETGAKKIRKEVELDLAKLKVKQDQELTYVIRVTDTKENAAATPATEKPASSEKHIAMNQPPAKPEEKKDAAGSKQPENKMPKRALDVGQCSACQPMRIVVDDWGRSFEGQMREKLEIAIDPVLKQLDELLAKAQQATEATRRSGPSPEQKPAMEGARENLRQADSAVSDLKKISHDTPYAFIGLQVDDIRDAHISPARKNLAAVALEAGTQKSDITNLEQGTFQIKRARERIAELTKSYESIKRDNNLSDAMQRLAKMHQIFLEDTQAMLGSSKPNLNPQERKVAEVSDAYADKLAKLLEEKKKILAELAKILAEDPRLLRRYLALEELDGTTLRDQMTLLAQRQQDLARSSAQWNAADAGKRAEVLKALLVAQAAEQKEISAMTSKMLENMVTWAPLDISVNKEPVAGCRKFAAEAARLASEAAAQTTPETLKAGLVLAKNALEQLRELQRALPGLDWITKSHENIASFEANRLNETAELITRQSGWVKKIESIQSGDFAQTAEVDQHRLLLDTTTLSEKLDSSAISAGALSPEIRAKAEELTGTMHLQILTGESSAMSELEKKKVPAAATRQAETTNAFAKGEQQFDELLHMIIAKLDAEPPPTDPSPNKNLEQILADLQDEKKACEKLGVPCRPINVSVLKDWMKPGSCNNPGEAQGRAAQAQARQAKEKAQKQGDRAKLLALQKVEELPPAEHRRAGKSGPKPAPASWNTLVSQLGDDLRQGRDNVPPEQYRQAIEQYFNTISEKPAETLPRVAAH